MNKLYLALGAIVIALVIGYGAWKQSMGGMDHATMPGMGNMNMGQAAPAPAP